MLQADMMKEGHRHTSIRHFLLDEILSAFPRLLLVDPCWLLPVLLWDEAEVDLALRRRRYVPTGHIDQHQSYDHIKSEDWRMLERCIPLELFIKLHIIQEHPRIPEVSIPFPLQHLDRTDSPHYIAVPREHHQRCISPSSARAGGVPERSAGRMVQRIGRVEVFVLDSIKDVLGLGEGVVLGVVLG
jgi:hypothetical protein